MHRWTDRAAGGMSQRLYPSGATVCRESNADSKDIRTPPSVARSGSMTLGEIDPERAPDSPSILDRLASIREVEDLNNRRSGRACRGRPHIPYRVGMDP